MTALLEVRHLSKTFPGLKALDDVSFTVHSGEITAVVGQNGSGKSTLVKVLAGIHAPDPGAHISANRFADGAEPGLHFIHQDLGLVADLSTIENLSLNHKLGRRAMMPNRRRQEIQHTQALIARFGADFEVTRPVGTLAPAERTIVAIARALDGWERPENVLVLDEPTAALHGDEVRVLFDAVRRVAERGAGVVFISHRLDEVIELADTLVALRDGHLIADVRRGEFDHDDLVRLIAGTIDEARVGRPHLESGSTVLQATDLRGRSIQGMDLELGAGEILGVSGVLGSGREELSGILFGARPGQVAKLVISSTTINRPTPSRCIAAGVAYVPGNRHRDGVVMTMTARENMTLPRLSPLRRSFGRIDNKAERTEVNGWIDRVGLTPPDLDREIRLFSGGNQQKVVLSKWLRNDPKVLLLDEPTQGVDVGAKTAIYELITTAARSGAGVLICSSDAKELALLCDRVIVLRDGRVAAQLHRGDITEAALLRADLDIGSTPKLINGQQGDDGNAWKRR